MIYFLSINYYSTELLRQLLQSISVLSFPTPYRFIIVNNSPNDSLVYVLEKEFEHVSILDAPGNLGFGGGCNLGLIYVYQQNPRAWVWLINPDATLVKGAMTYIRSCFRHCPDLSILGTRIRSGEQDIWFAQGRFNRWTGSLKHRLPRVSMDEASIDKLVAVLSTQWVSGCSMILNLNQFSNCPEFDTNFFLDYEDADICERYAQQGHTIGVTKAVLVDHAVSSITGRNRRAKFRHATFSKLYFLYKHGSWLALGINLAYILLWSVKLLVFDLEIGIGRFQGWVDFIFWWPRALLHQLPPTPFRPQTAFTQS